MVTPTRLFHGSDSVNEMFLFNIRRPLLLSLSVCMCVHFLILLVHVLSHAETQGRVAASETLGKST